MSKTTKIQANVDSDTVQHVNDILSQIGLTPTSAINILYHGIENYGGIPFDVKLVPERCQNVVHNNVQFDIAQIKRHVDDMLHYKYLRAISNDPMWINAAYALFLVHYLYLRSENREMSLDAFFDTFDYQDIKSKSAFMSSFAKDLLVVPQTNPGENRYLQEAYNQVNSFLAMCGSAKTRRTVLDKLYDFLSMNVFTPLATE